MILRQNNEAVFTAKMLKKWKVVPIKTTILAANSCHKGMNYIGYNKKEIYVSFAKLNTLGTKEPPQIHQFIPLMNALSKTYENFNEQIQNEINGLVTLYTQYK